MRHGVNLKAKLDAYEASSAVGSGAAAKKRQRTWPVYAAAAGSGLAMATSAEAGIVYSGPQNVTLAPRTNTGSASHSINIDGHGHNFVLGGYRSTVAHTFVYAGVWGAGRGGLQVLHGGSSLKNLASGAKISNGAGAFGGSAPFFLRLKIATIGGATRPPQLGTWPQSHVGFGGFKFTSGGQSHFGWIKLEWNGGTFGKATGIPTSITALGWAYETTPGLAIAAGAVPEPSTGVLALLASGSAGVLAWRKRRPRAAATEAGDGVEALN
jgi:hypothetical protein